MTATEYIKSLKLATGEYILKPVDEEHAIDMLILSHKNQCQTIKEQLKTIHAIPKWVLRWFKK
jgi:hypothetical protein